MVDSKRGGAMTPGSGDLRKRVDAVEHKVDELATSVDVRFDQVDAALVEQRAYTEFAYDRLNEKIDAGFATVDARFGQVDARFGQVDARFGQMDARFDRMDARFDQMDARLDRMDGRFDQMDARFDRMDARFDRMAARYARLERKLDQFIDHQLTAGASDPDEPSDV